MQWLLSYELVDDYVERRAALRAEHLQLAKDAVARGILLVGGALTEQSAATPTHAALFFQTNDPTCIEDFAKADPYVVHGLVKSWQIFRWNTVVGPIAEVQL